MTEGECAFLSGLKRKHLLVLVYQLLQETVLITFKEKKIVALCPNYDAW